MPYEMIRANNQPSPDDIELNGLDPGSMPSVRGVYDHDYFMYYYPLPLGFNPYDPGTHGYDNTPGVRRRNVNGFGDTTASVGPPVAPFVNIDGDAAYEYEPVGFYAALRRTDDMRTTDPRTYSISEEPIGVGDEFRSGTESRRDLYSIYGRRTIILDVQPDPADDDADIYPVDSPLDGGASALDPYPPLKGPWNKYQVRSKYGMKGKLVTVAVFWLPNRAPERYLRPDELNKVELKTFIPASNTESAVDVESDMLTSNNFLFISNPAP
jgi:hypothetical protein